VQWSFAPVHRKDVALESPVTQGRIYLDYAATTPLRSEALAAMMPYLEHPSLNPSSLHAEGRRARMVLEDARERVARAIGAKRKEIVFTASGSEADALAIVGVTCQRHGRHVVSCAIEHHAVLRTLDALRDEGYEISLLAVDRNGVVDPERFDASLRGDTALATIMYANNEIGTIEQIARLAEAAKRRGVPFHTDAVQAAEWLSLDVGELGIDLLSLSAHKFGGPQGIGMLYVRDGTALSPLVRGGGQESGRRSGTESVAAAVGAATALEIAVRERDELSARIRSLRDRLERAALASIEGSSVNAAGAERLPNQANFCFDGVPAEALAIALDLQGVAISPGSACTSGVAAASHVVAALGIGNPRNAVRFSLGRGTTSEEIERVIALLPAAVAQVRRGE
jgi:cysteine desulfurase